MRMKMLVNMLKGLKKPLKMKKSRSTAVIVVVLIFAVILVFNILNHSGLGGEVPDEEEGPRIIREPAVAGKFYPGEESALRQMINDYIGKAAKSGISNVKGLVAPHAGYVYSGPVAAYGFNELDPDAYETVIIIGPSHYVRFDGASIANVTHYRTPLGLVKLSPKAKGLIEEDVIVSVPQIHLYEHSVEVEIPFLQSVLTDFEVIPIVAGDVNPYDLASVLLPYIDDKTLIVASSDLSHYYPYAEAVSVDQNCVDSIPGLNFTGMKKCEACGKIPVLTLMSIAKELGWEGKALDYRNSGDTAGDKSRVVGYVSVAFYQDASKQALSKGEQGFLLSLANETLNVYLSSGSLPSIDPGKITPNLGKVQGCFVTLSKHGNLRGCIGHILPQEALWLCVRDNAISAALHDPRFPPVGYDELEDIEIEISVLSVPELLLHDSPEDLLDKLRPKIDGVVIKYQGRQSTYLPQVWDSLPDKNQFLSQLCLKQYSPADCWTKPGAEIYTYQAFVFHEQHK